MLRIRLARFGVKKRPTYRLAIFDRTKDNQGVAIDYVGSYNPRTNPKTIVLDAEKIKYWMSKGAQPTATIHNLLVDQKIIAGKKVKAFRLVKTEKPAEATPIPAAVAPAPEVKVEEPVATPEVKPEEPVVPAPESKPEEPAAPTV